MKAHVIEDSPPHSYTQNLKYFSYIVKDSVKMNDKIFHRKRNNAAINLLWEFALAENDSLGKDFKCEILRIVDPAKDIEVDLYNELISDNYESSKEVRKLQNKLKVYLRTIYPLDYKLSEVDTKLLWEFVRGDVHVEDFERWLYNNANLQKNFDEDFYFELTSVDYKSVGEVSKIRDRFAEYLRKTSILDCYCITFNYLTIVYEYNTPRTFEALTNVKSYVPQLIVTLCQCSKCGQYWLKAGFYEHIYFKRLEDAQAQKIIENNDWPKCFETVEELLMIANQHDLCIYDGDSDPALPYIIAEIVRLSQGITVSKLSLLLQLSYEATLKQSKKAVADHEVDITFQ